MNSIINRLCSVETGKKAIGILFFAVLVFSILLFLLNGFYTSRCPIAYDCYEPFVYQHSKIAADGGSLYGIGNTKDFPFVRPYYPPVFFYVTSIAMKVYNVVLTTGRFVSVAATLLTAFFMFLLVCRGTSSAIGGLTAAAVFLSMEPVQLWASMNRVDQLAAMFMVLGVLIYFTFEKHKYLWLLSAVVFVVGFFTKQSTVSTTGALILFLMFRDIRRALAVGGATAVLGAAVLFIANAATHGGFIEQVFIIPSVNVDYITKTRVVEMVLSFISSPLAGVAFGLFIFRLFTVRPVWFDSVYVVVSGAVMLLIMGNKFSNVNYLWELCAALALCTGMTVGMLKDEKALICKAILIIVFVPILMSVKNNVQVFRTGSHCGYSEADSEKVSAATAYIEKKFDADDRILFEDVQIPSLLGWKPSMSSTQEYNLLVKSGYYREDFLLRDIRSRKWDAIVLRRDDRYWARNDWFSAEQTAGIRSEYRELRDFRDKQDLYYLYVPKK